MVAIITGDIVHSRLHAKEKWLNALAAVLTTLGVYQQDWQIYHGDEFQLVCKNPEQALRFAFLIKAKLKTVGNVDVRMAVGLGLLEDEDVAIREMNGDAINLSVAKLALLKSEKLSLSILSKDTVVNKEIDLMMRWALTSMDEWSRATAEIVYYFLAHPGCAQKAAAKDLGVQQSAVSQRLKRAHFDLLIKTIDYYNSIVKKLKTAI